MRAPLLLHHRQTKTICLYNSTRHQMIVCFGLTAATGAASTHKPPGRPRRWPGRAAPDETYPREMSDSEAPVVSRVVTALCGGRQLDLLGDIPLNIPVDEPMFRKGRSRAKACRSRPQTLPAQPAPASRLPRCGGQGRADGVLSEPWLALLVPVRPVRSPPISLYLLPAASCRPAVLRRSRCVPEINEAGHRRLRPLGVPGDR